MNTRFPRFSVILDSQTTVVPLLFLGIALDLLVVNDAFRLVEDAYFHVFHDNATQRDYKVGNPGSRMKCPKHSFILQSPPPFLKYLLGERLANLGPFPIRLRWLIHFIATQSSLPFILMDLMMSLLFAVKTLPLI